MAKKGKFSQPRTPKYQNTDPDPVLSGLSGQASPTETAKRTQSSLSDDTLLIDMLLDEAVTAPASPAAPVSPAILPEDEDFVPDAESGSSAVSKNKKIMLISLCSVALVVLIGLFVSVFFFLGGGFDDGLILNNVTVAGVNLGGMTQEEAVRVLRAATENTYTGQDMVVVLPEATLTFSPADTGARLDVEAAAEAAYQFGRTGTRAEQEAARDLVLTGAHHIALLPYLQLNTDCIRDALDAYCSAYVSDFVPSSADLEGEMPELAEDKYDPDAPCQTLLLNPGVPGRNLDMEKLYAAILDAYSFNNFLVEIEADGLTEDPEKLDLEALLEELTREPVSATLDATTKEIIPGTYGYTFNLEEAQQLLDASEPGVVVRVPMEYVEPEFTGETMFGDVLGFCETEHTTDQNRNTNLRLVCDIINGYIIMPDEVFDYNEVVGKRTAERGFQYAAAYSGGQTVKELGGGICQVSSTLYYSALLADLEIVDRTEHSFVSTYIPYGLDATVSWGGPEFRFRNNTDRAIRIRAEVADGYVRVWLMGVDDRDYYVEMEYRILAWEDYETVYEEYAPDNEKGYEDGEVIVTPYVGCTVRTYRCRYDKETGELISREEEVRSKYKKRDEVIVKIVDPSTEPSEDATADPTEDTGSESTDPSVDASTEASTEATTEATVSPPSDDSDTP